MSIRSYLTSTLGVTHCFDLDNSTVEIAGVGSPSPTDIQAGAGYSFVSDPVCYGVTQSLLSTNSADFTTRTDGAVIDRRKDINNSSDGTDASAFDYVSNSRTMALWFKGSDFSTPSCIYEQGGGTNNFAFVSGIAKAITFQAADAGTPFLIVQSNFLGVANRPYFIVGIWEHSSEHAGSGNRCLLHINGVLQEIVEVNTTASFPNHSGDITLGNTAESLKAYNEDTIPYATRSKNCNFLIMVNNRTWTVAESREFFERTVIPNIVIAADTVANQQIALDALTGNNYSADNCAIQIRQATDATDYRLFIDNINFVRDTALDDIAVMYVGPNTLTIENTNGSDAYQLATPVEVDLDGSTVLAGGGTLTLVEKTIRYIAAGITVTNSQDTKMVVEAVGSYTISGGILQTFENISGGAVTLNLSNGAATPTIINSSGSTTAVLTSATITITGLTTGSRVKVTRDDTSAVILNAIEVGGQASLITSYTGIFTVTVRKASTAPYYKEWIGGGSTANGSTSVNALQELD
ncbi:MAG: hypothetical protein COB36_10650 [Alphaproteobacteria bacterium]|nr:MAG: hypothetical protein COB36_10650 [Alphaproteobacteria bacterium]